MAVFSLFLTEINAPLLQIVSGRHRQVMFALRHLIGAAAESASQWRRSSLFTRSVVKEMLLFGALYIKSIQSPYTDKVSENL